MIDVLTALSGLGPVFRSADAARVGLSPKVVRRALRAGILRRLAPGCFTPESVWSAARPADRQVLLAQVAHWQRPWAVVSHHTAAAVHGLPGPPHPPAWVALTTDRGTGTADGGVARLEPGALPADAVVAGPLGLRVTAVARTVVDCLRTLPLADGVAIADAAVGRGLVSLPALSRERSFQKGWPHVTDVDCGLWLLDPVRESSFESVSFTQLWIAGVRVPEHQVTVLDDRGRFVARVDGLWRDEAVVGEADGEGKYLDRLEPDDAAARSVARALVAEKRREDRLRDLGLDVVRWSPTETVGVRADRVRRAWSSSRRPFLGRLVSHEGSRHRWRATVDEPVLRTRPRRHL